MPGVRDVWGFANNIIRTSRLLLNEALEPLNLSSAEANILLLLVVQGDRVRQDHIADRLDVSKASVSRALESLQRKGYVARERSQSDRRVSMVSLTPAARDIYPQVEQAYETLFEAASRGVSEDEVAAFTELFRRISENLTRARQAMSGHHDRERRADGG